MNFRHVTIAGIFVLFCGTLFLTFFYGPLRRAFVSPGAIGQAFTGADIMELWGNAGVKGRSVILFTRHLNSEESPKDTNGVKFVDVAMKYGIARTVYHIVPDNSWDVVSDHLSPRKNVRITSSGFVLIVPEGRIHISPLSKIPAINEKSLIIFEPGIWSSEERSQIEHLLNSGKISTDLFTIIRGTAADIIDIKSKLHFIN